MNLKHYKERYAGHDFTVTYGTLVSDDRREITVMLRDGDKVLHLCKYLPDLETLDEEGHRIDMCYLCLEDYKKKCDGEKTNGNSDV